MRRVLPAALDDCRRLETVESAESIRSAVEYALCFYPASRLFLNPDCGFGTFSNRPMNSEAVAAAKVARIVEAARDLRAG